MIEPYAQTEWQLKQSGVGQAREVKFVAPSQTAHDTDDSKRLKKIIKKYRIQHYVNTFREKIKRNNTNRAPARFQLAVNEQTSNRWLHMEGVEIKSKTLESFIFAGDIIFSLIVFYIAVFQAFMENFRNEQSSSYPIIVLKITAICFQFLKVFLKSIKKDFVNGKSLNYIHEIIWQSTGLIDLILYSSAICLIILSIVYHQDYDISVAAFFIATIKLFKIPINLQVLDMHYINSHRRQLYWNLVKVILFEVVFMHFVAGLLLAMTALDSQKNWMIYHGLQEQPWAAQYSWALYWSATLVTTTGFGDFIATNEQEALLVAALELFSSVVLAYNLNVIGTIVMSLRNTDQDLEHKLATFQRMSYESPVSPLIEQKIFSYISYEKEVQQKFQFEERATFLNELPHQLKAEYESDVNQTIFHQLPFFCNLRLETLNNLAFQFSNKVCYPGQNLVPCKEESHTILVLRRGEVDFQYHRVGANKMNGIAIESFVSNQSFKPKPVLLNNTFINRNRTINYDIIARQYSLIMTLTQQAFMEAIRTSEIEKEHFFTIYDKHDTFIFGATKCQFCPEEYHNKFECPKIHFIPFNCQIISKHQLQAGNRQPRLSITNKKSRKEHCYYLRRNYYQPYESYNNINSKSANPNIINRINRMKTFVEQLNHQELLLSFEQTFRKIITQNQVEVDPTFGTIDIDVMHDYLSYFSEGNPKELVGRRIKKKTKFQRTNIDHRLTLLAASSKRLLYRQAEEEKKEKVDKILKDSLMLSFY